MTQYAIKPEIVLGNVESGIIPEINVSYTRQDKAFIGTVGESRDVANFIRSIYDPQTIELQEQFFVLFLNQRNEIIGYYKHSKGAINVTVADIRIILATALKSLAISIIIAHNHPSGSLIASDADKKLTAKLKEAARLMEISLLDHIIVTPKSYLSFAEQGLVGLEGVQAKDNEFVEQVMQDLVSGKKQNKLSLEKLAASFGIYDKNQIKELTELAIVSCARTIAHNRALSRSEQYEQIVRLYHTQANLSHRTSNSMLLQQYSTPAPIGYLMGAFCQLDKLELNGAYAFEPSAGNGLLTIVAAPQRVYVNEIDEVRLKNLKKQNYAGVWQRDATEEFYDVRNSFQAVLTNPPFGTLDKSINIDGFPIQSLENIMAIRALETMTRDGRAAIIIGGHTSWDTKGRIQAGKNRLFFNYLYHHYHIVDVIQIDGKKLYSRQGTSFDTRLILIEGRKEHASGVAPTYNKERDLVIGSFESLYQRVMEAIAPTGHKKPNDRMTKDIRSLEQAALALAAQLSDDGLGAPYNPSSDACVVLDTQVPDSMAFETQDALERIKEAVGGDVDNFVRDRLGYPSKMALCKALSAEQTDAVMMAIYNIEARRQGMIIGDQTGIGKGRVAASMIRYTCQQGKTPVFLTEKANLFSDIYRDLLAIGSGHLRPFIVNGRESKTDIKDEDGNIVYQALPANEQQVIFRSRQVPPEYDYILATYSQFNSPEKKPEKPAFLNEIAEDNIFIMDEAHNSSGSSNTGSFLQGVIAKTSGVTFLSATFAKRPDNMPIYAMKTAIADCNMSKDELVEAIQRGGVALQEVLSSQLVAEGQMLRRERSFEGIEVNYITLDDTAEEHRAIADNITQLLRDIIAFQGKHVNPIIEELDNIAISEGQEVNLRDGTSQAGVDNQPYFSKVFNVINQMLFSIKASSVADRTIERLKEGKKPVIAFASTMGSFLETLADENGLAITDGSLVDADFSEVMRRGLDGVMRYTLKDFNGKAIYKSLSVDELSPEGQLEYQRISEQINSISTGITISPIDVVIQKIKSAGYTVAEVTGRKFELQMNWKGNKALVMSRKKINTNDAFRKFNNDEVDVLMINQSGSTGASAHAIPTSKVPAAKVRQRVMIVLQAELDINTEVQKRGRINRTGQILKPIYDYVSSAIPAEKRLMMMLQKKLKSLDANTASNQKQSNKILDVPDFLNKYGDKIVKEYLIENPEINLLLDDPLKLGKSSADSGGDDKEAIEDAAHRVSGRVAVLSTQMQQDFYNEISERYAEYVNYLQQIGEYDLELEAMNLQAETIKTKVVKMGLGTDSVFGEDSVMETVKANVLRKPFSSVELDNLLTESLKGEDPFVLQSKLITEYQQAAEERFTKEIEDSRNYYAIQINKIESDKKIAKIKDDAERAEAIKEKEIELMEARELKAAQIRKAWENKRAFMERLLRFFHVGQKLYYPMASFVRMKEETEMVSAVFLGFIIDKKQKNPYAASAIKLRFAIGNSNKYLVLPASYYPEISSIMGVSNDLIQPGRERLLAQWESSIQRSNTTRNTRYIITGNLLQAFADYKGKLVSYTTIDEKVEKGILMPDYWEPDEQGQSSVSVPIIKSLPFVKGLSNGQTMRTSLGIVFMRIYDGRIKIIVPGSRSKSGEFYLDKEVLELVQDRNFNKTADKMVGYIDNAKLEELFVLMQRKYTCSVELSMQQFKTIENEQKKVSSRENIRIPEPETATTTNQILILELEAEAVLLALQLA